MNKNTEHKNKITPKREQDALSFEPDDFKTNRSLATIGQELGGEWEAFGDLRYGELLNQNGGGGVGGGGERSHERTSCRGPAVSTLIVANLK